MKRFSASTALDSALINPHLTRNGLLVDVRARRTFFRERAHSLARLKGLYIDMEAERKDNGADSTGTGVMRR